MIIGYTAGTFDMFHIGHLNLLQNARRQCDQLIVGVNTDELVLKYKSKTTVVPLEERIQIVGAIHCVAKAVVVDSLDKTQYHQQLGFNKLFIGDDWKGNQRWELTQKEMADIGVRVVFLPYTKVTSSTILREKLLNLIPN